MFKLTIECENAEQLGFKLQDLLSVLNASASPVTNAPSGVQVVQPPKEETKAPTKSRAKKTAESTEGTLPHFVKGGGKTVEEVMDTPSTPEKLTIYAADGSAEGTYVAPEAAYGALLKLALATTSEEEADKLLELNSGSLNKFPNNYQEELTNKLDEHIGELMNGESEEDLLGDAPSKPITQEEARDRFSIFMDSHGTVLGKKLLTDFKVAKFSELKQEQYAEFFKFLADNAPKKSA